MKKLMLVSLVVFAAASVQAANLSPKDPSQYKGSVPEFCAYDSMSNLEDADQLFVIEEQDIKKVANLSPFYLSLVNDYLIHQGYFEQPQTFATIKALFTKGGPEASNDLYIFTRTSKKTAETHIEVRTYPGDNPVGDIYNTEGLRIGENGDDSYSFSTPEGSFWCSSMN